MTYPHPAVIDYINKHFIPVRYNIQTNPDIKNTYRLLWAPTVIVLDLNGTDYHRFNGFLPPDEFIPQLEFGIAKMALEKQDLKAAKIQFTSVVEKYPQSDIAPEAQYWVGVVDFQLTHDVSTEINAWKKIQEHYPGSIWARKVSGAISCEKE
ncbi:MAG: thioredoxin family protein [Candidatus Jettenia caeni]|nr:thioredoxin family protein [Candidatus Jettenia caeni]